MENVKYIIYILLALGFPVSFGFGWDVTGGDFWQSLLMTGVYGLIVTFVGFFRQVWGNFEQHVVQDISDKLIRRWIQWTASYKRRYLSQMRYRYRELLTEGLSLRTGGNLWLTPVFVQLRIIEDVDPDKIARAILSEKSRGQAGTDIWSILNNKQRLRFAILGAPGAGKTTLLRSVILELCKRWNKPLDLLPIYITLRYHGETISNNPDVSLHQLILDEKLFAGHDEAPPKDWFDEQLRENRCLVMFDGLDEIADPMIRSQVISWIRDNITGDNRLIIASRPGGAYAMGEGLLELSPTLLKVLEFNPEQQREFIHKWYREHEVLSGRRDHETRRKAREDADDLITAINRIPTLAQLAVNPLLLTLITSVKQGGNELPDARSDLYEEIVDVFLWRRAHKKRGRITPEQIKAQQTKLNKRQKKHLLQYLAYELMKRQTEDADIDTLRDILSDEVAGILDLEQSVPDFLQSTMDSTGLLAGNRQEGYRFAHRSFLEYFAAHYVVDNQGARADLFNEFTRFAQQANTYWHEAMIHYCDSGADASVIISSCIAVTDAIQPLILALNCMNLPNIRVNPTVRQEFQKFLDMSINHNDPLVRRHIAEAQLGVHLNTIERRIGEDTYLIKGFITQAEYQLFIDDMLTHGTNVIPDHWGSANHMQGDGGEPILGIRGSDAQQFCEWLTKHNTSGWVYRLPETLYLGHVLQPHRCWSLSGGTVMLSTHGLPVGAGHIAMRSTYLTQVLAHADAMVSEQFDKPALITALSFARSLQLRDLMASSATTIANYRDEIQLFANDVSSLPNPTSTQTRNSLQELALVTAQVHGFVVDLSDTLAVDGDVTDRSDLARILARSLGRGVGLASFVAQSLMPGLRRVSEFMIALSADGDSFQQFLFTLDLNHAQDLVNELEEDRIPKVWASIVYLTLQSLWLESLSYMIFHPILHRYYHAQFYHYYIFALVVGIERMIYDLETKGKQRFGNKYQKDIRQLRDLIEVLRQAHDTNYALIERQQGRVRIQDGLMVVKARVKPLV